LSFSDEAEPGTHVRQRNGVFMCSAIGGTGASVTD
jgi:hypothetical protein